MLNNNIKPVGLKLPLQRGSNGFFEQNFNTIDQAHTNIKNMLLTMYGERRLNVGFGTNFYRLVFSQIDSDAEIIASIESEILFLIEDYFPYVNVVKLNITFPENNTHRINIDLTFQLKNSNNVEFGASEQKRINVTINTNTG